LFSNQLPHLFVEAFNMIQIKPAYSLIISIGVGAQATLEGHKIFAQKYILNHQNARILNDSCLKIIIIPEFLYLPEKFTKIPEFYMIFARKCPNFT